MRPLLFPVPVLLQLTLLLLLFLLLLLQKLIFQLIILLFLWLPLFLLTPRTKGRYDFQAFSPTYKDNLRFSANLAKYPNFLRSLRIYNPFMIYGVRLFSTFLFKAWSRPEKKERKKKKKKKKRKKGRERERERRNDGKRKGTGKGKGKRKRKRKGKCGSGLDLFPSFSICLCFSSPSLLSFLLLWVCSMKVKSPSALGRRQWLSKELKTMFLFLFPYPY